MTLEVNIHPTKHKSSDLILKSDRVIKLEDSNFRTTRALSPQEEATNMNTAHMRFARNS